MAFLGVPSCDELGNANGYTGGKPAAAPSATQWLMPTTQNRL
ncbi:citrate lyase subunit alpha [Escherichia coli]